MPRALVCACAVLLLLVAAAQAAEPPKSKGRRDLRNTGRKPFSSATAAAGGGTSTSSTAHTSGRKQTGVGVSDIEPGLAASTPRAASSSSRFEPDGDEEGMGAASLTPHPGGANRGSSRFEPDDEGGMGAASLTPHPDDPHWTPQVDDTGRRREPWELGAAKAAIWKKKHWKVVVLGAGLAGLNTAYNLIKQHGFARNDVLVVDARPRIGGRSYGRAFHPAKESWTHLPKLMKDYVAKHGLKERRDGRKALMKQFPSGGRRDEGGEFIGNKQVRMNHYINKFHVDTRPILKGSYAVFENTPGQVSRSWLGIFPFDKRKEDWDMLMAVKDAESMSKSVDVLKPYDNPETLALDSTTLEDWCREHLGEDTKPARFFKTFLGVVFGAPADTIPMFHLAYFLKSVGGMLGLQGSGDKHCVNGSISIAEGLLKDAQIHTLLGRPVEAVKRVNPDTPTEQVEITLRGGRVLHADYVVVSMPFPAIKRLKFTPPHPAPRQKLLDGTSVAAFDKVHILCPNRFWTENDYLQAGFSVEGPLNLLADGSSPIDKTVYTGGDEALLIGFLIDPAARRWRGDHNKEERHRAIRDQLHTLLDPKSATNRFDDCEIQEMVWQNEEFSRGVTTIIAPNTLLTQVNNEWVFDYLYKPWGHVFWAGSDKATEWFLYMEGALMTGERAAAQVAQLDCARKKTGSCSVRQNRYVELDDEMGPEKLEAACSSSGCFPWFSPPSRPAPAPRTQSLPTSRQQQTSPAPPTLHRAHSARPALQDLDFPFSPREAPEPEPEPTTAASSTTAAALRGRL